jgi:glycosyltransferase involved in cell wall biosynthesis
MNIRRIIVDLTDLEQWAGTHGGIQRVVYGISKEFFLNSNNECEIVFATFNAQTQSFYETNFKSIYDRVDRHEVGSLQSSKPRQESARQRFADGVKRKIRKSAAEQPLLKRAGLVLFEDDVVLVMGMSWENPGIQSVLGKARDKVGVKVVQIVYDLIIPLQPHLHHPANIEPYTRNMVEVIKNSDLLIPISKSSDRDLAQFAARNNLDLPPTRVVRLSDKSVEGATSDKPVKPSPLIRSNFIACVGTVEVRKNHTLLYYAYKLAAERNIKLPQLVIVGGRGWYTGDLQHLLELDPQIGKNILLLDNVNDSGLKWVFRHCLFTVYPSMYEGWGLPIAESLLYGKMCLSSHASSMPEIAGDLIDYFSPYSPEECLEKIIFYMNDDNRIKREKEITRQYVATSWEQTSEQIVEYIKSMK